MEINNRFKTEVREITEKDQKKLISFAVLTDLPEWFGLPDSTKEYIEESSEMPFFASYYGGELTGFAALNETGPQVADVFVMGVLKKYHGKGSGKALMRYFEEYAKAHNYQFLQVKTVEMGRYEQYDRTNRFYRSCGFTEFEVFPDLWDVWNPCQIYIRYIGL